jgi:hypothetical protein
MTQKVQKIFTFSYEHGQAVLRRIHRNHMFLGLPDPDPLFRGLDPDPDPAMDPDLSVIYQI